MIDHLIIGGGSAGCVLAARLSEDADRNIVLVEAGRDLVAGSVPDNIRSRYPGYAFVDEKNIWPALTATFAAGKDNEAKERHARRYEQARVLGGGSAINAMVANRGAPGDYDEWHELGATGWSWEAVFPYFRKIERDCDIDNEYHGQNGPIPVRRHQQEKASLFVQAVCRALQAHGHPFHTDQNGEWTDGVFPAVIATTDAGERIPASIAYLTPQVRSRPNLTILTEEEAVRINFEGKRAIGAEIAPSAAGGGDAKLVEARETLVCCGGIHSPALLMRSGIGAAAELSGHGIAVVADLPGVGRNLMEHPMIACSAYLPAASRLADLGEHHDQALLRFSSGIGDAPAGDMHMAILGRTGWHAVGQRMGTTLIWVNKAYSRGAVTLHSASPREGPVVDLALLSDWRDLERLKAGFRLAAQTLSDPILDGVRGPVFPTSFSARVAKLLVPNPANRFQMNLFGMALDLAGGLRETLINKVITLGVELDDLLADETALTNFVSSAVAGVWHASGTCRMGSADDRLAVTDEVGRVRGVEGLRVCDASLMPSIPRANINMPILMLSERIADLIRQDA